MTTRVHRSREEWQQLVNDHADSGLTQSAFCRQRKINPVSFNKWKRQLEKEVTDDDWVSLTPEGFRSPGFDIELELGNGMVLRLRQS